jgi:hypothetical protein
MTFKSAKEIRLRLLAGELSGEHWARWILEKPDQRKADSVETWKHHATWRRMHEGLAKYHYQIGVLFDPVAAHVRRGWVIGMGTSMALTFIVGLYILVRYGPETHKAASGPIPPTPGSVGGGTLLRWIERNGDMLLWVLAFLAVMLVMALVGVAVGRLAGAVVGRHRSQYLPRLPKSDDSTKAEPDTRSSGCPGASV